MRGDGRVFLRGKTWHIAYYGPTHKGWAEIKETARTQDEGTARKFLARRVRAVKNHKEGLGRFVGPAEGKIRMRTLIETLIQRMTEDGLKSVRTARSQVRHFLDEFGGVLARDVTSASLRSYQQQRLGQGAAKATVDRELELVRRAFRIAFDDRKVASVPGTPKLLTLHGNARKVFITPTQFGALLPHIKDSDFRDWMLWFWWTGMRNGEISSLTWDGFEDGDPPLMTLAAENAKTGESRWLPVVGPLREIVNRRLARRLPDCPLVFHSSGRSFRANHGGLPRWWYEEWREACEAIGRPELRPYDLRRSAVRNLIHSGVPELTAMKITGHKSRDTFRRYAIEDPSEIAAAIETTDAYVTPKMNPDGTIVRFPPRTRTHAMRKK